MSTAAPNRWQYALVVGLVLSTMVFVIGLPPIAQDPAYHNFADGRTLLGISNALDVLSNLPFLLVGLAGVRHCVRSDVGPMRTAWVIFFVGVTLVSAGSAFYHWNPTSPTLVWDRLPMTVAFMAIFAALLGECLNAGFGRRLLFPAIAVGVASVVVWARADDLRFYAWVQFMPMLILPIVLLLFRIPYTQGHLLMFALGWYVLAKIAEFLDNEIFALTLGLVSGHSLKHLFAAATCYCVLLMLQRRQPRTA